MRAIGYARVSTTKQDLARQRCKITNFCAENGYELASFIEDFGISGATLQREGYQKLNSLTSEYCDVLIVSEISRLSRKEQITEALSDIQNILKRGISVILLDNPSKIYQANEDLKLDELIMLVFQLYGAAQERTEIKRKNQDGKQALFRANPYAVVDAKIPYGFRSVPNTLSNRPKYLLEQNPEEAKVVKKIFELVLDGKTLYGVMQYLNDRNIMIRKGMPSLPILSRIIHNELYIGIRKRTQSFGKEEGKEDVAIQHIEPIISEDDFIKAGEKIATNNKFVATGKVYYNPFKGIIKCRCGRSMMVKDKKPEKGVSKLTYRCSCNESRNSPMFCSYNIDEISYELTNSVIKSLFIQRSQEITDYFREMSVGKIKEFQEVINGIDAKCSFNRERKKQVENEYSLNEKKLLATNNTSFISILEREREKIDRKNVEVEKEYSDLLSKKRDYENLIKEIEKANRTADVYERITNISKEEQTELYHLYLEKIEYYPATLMKGIYKVTFKSGNSFYIAISKVRRCPQAFLINGNGNGKCTVDVESGDINYNYEFAHPNSGIKNINFGWETKSGTVNIRDFFDKKFDKSPFALEIDLDLSYREKYKEKLEKASTQKTQPSQT